MDAVFSLVVVSDPAGRVDGGVGAVFVARPPGLLIGDVARATLRLRGLPHLVMLDVTGDGEWRIRSAFQGHPVAVNGALLTNVRAVRDGDRVVVGDVVFVVSAASAAADIDVRGRWLRLRTQWRNEACGPVFGLLDGQDGALAWMVNRDAHRSGDVVLEAFVDGAGVGIFPRVIERIAKDGRANTVFAVGAHVDLDEFARRAAPAPSIGLRLAVALADAQLFLWHRRRLRQLPVVVVGFDGRFVALPGRLPPASLRRDDDDDDDEDDDDDDDDDENDYGPLGSRQVRRWLRALAPALAAQVPRGVELDIARNALRRLAIGTPPADDAEVAAVVAGLFPDEKRRAEDVVEQLSLLDEDGRARLTRG